MMLAWMDSSLVNEVAPLSSNVCHMGAFQVAVNAPHEAGLGLSLEPKV